jgi:chaperone required for assembly of F1-ATPase
MRDIFEEIFINQPLDPTEAARRSLRPAALRRRFYREATAAELEGGFTILLDGKPVRTPVRRPLAAPTRSLAEAIATEWEAQSDVVDPSRMPLTRLANTIIDGVATSVEAVAADVVKYLGSDLVFYRAEQPDGLVARQAQHWDPLIGWARAELGARFVLAAGVMHVSQPEHALAAVAAHVPRDPWRLGAVHSITTLTGSALIALALAAARLPIDEAWAAAHVDEDWNMEQWGGDALALARREFQFAEMKAAADVLTLR